MSTFVKSKSKEMESNIDLRECHMTALYIPHGFHTKLILLISTQVGITGPIQKRKLKLRKVSRDHM